jgi:organic radical activating enzyme/intein/homing endonuclease
MVKINSFTAADSIPVKLIKNEKLLKSMRVDKVIPPIHVQFIPTNKCNLNCSFCSCSEDDRKTEMSLDNARRIIDKLQYLGTQSVTVTGGGEPLLYPHIQELLSIFHEAHIKIGLVTNGLLLDKYSYENVTWCRISNSDERFFNPAYFENLRTAVTENTNVDWAFSHVVSSSPNFSEIRYIIEFANLYNFTHVRLVADLLNYDKVNLERVRDDLERNNIEDSRVIYQSRNAPLKGGNCYICYLKPVISADCKVFACCLEAEEPVLIKRNDKILYIPIKDTKPGDYACEYGEILNVFHKDGEEGLEIVLQNNRTIYVSKDHLMLKLSDPQIKHEKKKLLSEFNLDTIEALELEIGDLLPVKYKYDPNNSTDKNISIEEAEFMGYYVAEGWSYDKIYKVNKKYLSRNTKIDFMFGKEAKEYIKRFEEICSILNFNFSMTELRTGMQYQIEAPTPYDDLITHCGFKAVNKRIPVTILNGTEEIKWAFIKGYFGGDDHLQTPIESYDGYKMRMSTVSRRLTNDLVYLFATLGIQASLEIERRAGKMIIEGREVNVKDRYHILVGEAYNLVKVPFLDIKQTKEQSPQRALGFLKNEEKGIMFVPVKEIRKRNMGKLVDIQVKGSNKFVAPFGIIVHNCGAQYALKKPSKTLPKKLCLGSAFDIDKIIMGSSKPFDGKICYRCYYTNYNNILEAILTDTQHMEFV